MPTSAGSGKWTVGATWVGGIAPVNGDVVVVDVGHTVEYDADMTAWANGVDLTINGTLEASTTAGSYVLKMSANMDGSGTLRAGTEAVPYPMTCVFEIMRNGFNITATNMTIDLNCTEPTYQYIKCTGAEAAGQTVLEVDTDVTGDIWAAGDIIRVDDVNGLDSEERVIAAGGIAAGSITITAGLSNAKIVGALVILITRNVRITHTALAGTAVVGGTGHRICAQVYGFNFGVQVASSVIGGSLSNGAYATQFGALNTYDGVISGISTSALENTSNSTLNGVISGSRFAISGTSLLISATGLISGCSYGTNSGSRGVVVHGTIDGCMYGIFNAQVMVIGSITNCTYGILGGGGIVKGTVANCTYGIGYGTFDLLGATLFGNTVDIYQQGASIRGYNASLNSATQVNYATSAPPVGWPQVAIWDIGGVAGAFKAWMRGGRVQSEVLGGITAYHYFVESADYPVFMDRFAEVEPGDTITATANVLGSVAPIETRWQLFRIEDDPLLGGTVLDEDIISDLFPGPAAEGSVTWTNTTDGPVSVVIRGITQGVITEIYIYNVSIINGRSATSGATYMTGEAIGVI